MSEPSDQSLDAKSDYEPAAPQFQIHDLLSLTFLVAGICGAWSGSFWAFTLGMFGFMFLLTRAMMHPRVPAMRVSDFAQEDDSVQLCEKLKWHGFGAAIVSDSSAGAPDRSWYVVVPASEARRAFEFLLGPHLDGQPLPYFTSPRCVFLADNDAHAGEVAGWLATQGIPATFVNKIANVVGKVSAVPYGVPVFVQRRCDAELAIDTIARQCVLTEREDGMSQSRNPSNTGVA